MCVVVVIVLVRIIARAGAPEGPGGPPERDEQTQASEKRRRRRRWLNRSRALRREKQCKRTHSTALKIHNISVYFHSVLIDGTQGGQNHNPHVSNCRLPESIQAPSAALKPRSAAL